MQSEKMKNEAKAIFLHAVKASDPRIAIRQCTRVDQSTLLVGKFEFDLDSFQNVVVCGYGKASAQMAAEVEAILGHRITQGKIVTKYGHASGLSLNRTLVFEAGHPTPDESGVNATREIVDMLTVCDEATLIVNVVSGGGSALLCSPAEGLSLSDLVATNNELLSCGADIVELNTIRKHLSRVKGGQLSRIAFPATIVSLILSDIIGDPLDAIASGPTVPDPTTYSECIAIIEKYDLQEKLPRAVIQHLRHGVEGIVPETPKPQVEYFDRCFHHIVASNSVAIEAAAQWFVLCSRYTNNHSAPLYTYRSKM